MHANADRQSAPAFSFDRERDRVGGAGGGADIQEREEMRHCMRLIVM
jgi:hypothetical protein